MKLNEPMAIYGIMAENITPCEHYRVMQPLMALAAKGHRVAYTTVHELMKATVRGMRPWEVADIILFNRLCIPAANERDFLLMIDTMRHLNPVAKIICDFDDDLTGVYRKVMPDDWVIPNLKAFDGVTVTNTRLRSVMLKSHPRVWVIPNYVASANFAGQIRVTPPVTIGVIGTHTHGRDWDAIVRPLNRICAIHPDVQVIVVGSRIDALSMNYQTPQDFGYPEVTLTFDEYPWAMAQADILLIPLDPTDKFNLSKSNLKALEAGASVRQLSDNRKGGCAVIAVEDPPNYLDVIRNADTGILVRQWEEDDWFKAMHILITEQKYREKLQHNLFNRVMTEWDIMRGAENIERVYRTIANVPKMNWI